MAGTARGGKLRHGGARQELLPCHAACARSGWRSESSSRCLLWQQAGSSAGHPPFQSFCAFPTLFPLGHSCCWLEASWASPPSPSRGRDIAVIQGDCSGSDGAAGATGFPGGARRRLGAQPPPCTSGGLCQKQAHGLGFVQPCQSSERGKKGAGGFLGSGTKFSSRKHVLPSFIAARRPPKSKSPFDQNLSLTRPK